jgi:hypothetical protein
MPDIMMCDAKGCERSPECYRHADSGTVANEYRQTFWLRDASSPVGGACKNFVQASPAVRAAHDGTF